MFSLSSFPCCPRCAFTFHTNSMQGKVKCASSNLNVACYVCWLSWGGRFFGKGSRGERKLRFRTRGLTWDIMEPTVDQHARLWTMRPWPLQLESCAKVRALELLTQETSPQNRDDCIVCILARRWLSWRQCTVLRLCSSLWCMFFLRTMRKRYLPALSKDRHLWSFVYVHLQVCIYI